MTRESQDKAATVVAAPGGSAVSARRPDGRTPSEASRGAGLLAQCRALLTRRLFERLPTMMDKVDDALYNLAEKAEDNRTQAVYFDAMRHVRLQRGAMEERFRAALAEGMDEAAGQRDPAALEDSVLALVDPDELEESLAVTNMVEKVHKSCRHALFALDRRVAALTGFKVDDQRPGHGNPFSPEVICEAFRSACAELEVDIALRLRVLKLFDRHVVVEVAGVYEALNALLVQNGVLPEIRTEVKHTAAAGPAGGAAPPGAAAAAAGIPGAAGGVPPTGAGMGGAGPGGGTVGGGMAGGGMAGGAYAPGAAAQSGPMAGAMPISHIPTHMPAQVLDTLHQVMTIQGAMEASQDNAAQSEVITALNQFQHAAAAGGAAGVVNQISALSGSDLANRMQPVDQILIDVVAMMFDYIFDDGSMPSEMQALIGRLQIPVLKVAILDKSFFARKFHVARGLLNRLADAGLGWNDRYGGDAAFYERIEALVERVIHEFEDNLEVFDEVSAELEAFIAEEDRKADENAWWTVKVIEGQERMAAARSAVRDLLDEALQRPGLPRTLRAFLDERWRELLTTCYVRDGADSEAWVTLDRTTRSFVWSLFPHEDDPQWRGRLLRELHDIVNAVTLALRDLPLAAAESKHFFDILAQHHINMIRGVSAAEAEALEAGVSAGAAQFDTEGDDAKTGDHPVAAANLAGSAAEAAGVALERVLASLRASIETANGEVLAAAEARPECKGMGTTVVAVQFNGGWASIGHVGDSRLYRLRAGALEQVTRDHSLREDLIARGFYTRKEVEQKVASNYITRAIGVDADVQVDTQQLATCPGDVFLLCSDGLSDMLSDADMLGVIEAQQADLEGAARQLVAAANEAGGRDNISVALVRVLGAGDDAPVAEPQLATAPDIQVAGVCDPGRRRSNNEDCVYASVRRGLVIVADGMGGHNAGEVASSMTVEAIRAAMAALRFAAPVAPSTPAPDTAAADGAHGPTAAVDPGLAAIDALLLAPGEVPTADAGAGHAAAHAFIANGASADHGEVEDIVLVSDDGNSDTDWAAFDQAYIDQARAMRVGTWLQFKRPDGAVRRARLSWISEVSGKYLFTDRSGATVADPSVYGLAIELRRGSAEVIDEVPLFDRAMSSLTHKLRGLQAPAH